MALAVLISAWLVGVFGGLHCLAMCGGFMAAAAMRDGNARGAAGAPMLPARTIARRQLAYHVGRLGTYALLGAAFGATGAAALGAADFIPVQRALYVVANAFLLLLAASLVTRSPAIDGLQRAGARAFGAALPMLQPFLSRPGAIGRLALGVVWGLVPCALVYGTLPLALFAGGAWQGAAVMLAFGLGTLPNLLAANVLVARARPLVGRTAWRTAAASVLAAFGAAGIYRVFYDPAALAQGPFCLPF